jgi:hypothetical protein
VGGGTPGRAAPGSSRPCRRWLPRSRSSRSDGSAAVVPRDGHRTNQRRELALARGGFPGALRMAERVRRPVDRRRRPSARRPLRGTPASSPHDRSVDCHFRRGWIVQNHSPPARSDRQRPCPRLLTDGERSAPHERAHSASPRDEASFTSDRAIVSDKARPRGETKPSAENGSPIPNFGRPVCTFRPPKGTCGLSSAEAPGAMIVTVMLRPRHGRSCLQRCCFLVRPAVNGRAQSPSRLKPADPNGALAPGRSTRAAPCASQPPSGGLRTEPGASAPGARCRPPAG